eukprot:5250036-Lingulodinium_polyedra.AAC.1
MPPLSRNKFSASGSEYILEPRFVASCWHPKEPAASPKLHTIAETIGNNKMIAQQVPNKLHIVAEALGKTRIL